MKKYTRVGPFASGFGWLLCWLGFHRREFAHGYAHHLDKGEVHYEAGFFCGRCGLDGIGKTKEPRP